MSANIVSFEWRKQGTASKRTAIWSRLAAKKREKLRMFVVLRSTHKCHIICTTILRFSSHVTSTRNAFKYNRKTWNEAVIVGRFALDLLCFLYYFFTTLPLLVALRKCVLATAAKMLKHLTSPVKNSLSCPTLIRHVKTTWNQVTKNDECLTFVETYGYLSMNRHNYAEYIFLHTHTHTHRFFSDNFW